MNTMSILLGATFALLLAAVVLSFQNMNHEVKSSSPEELAILKKQVELLTLEQDIWRRERESQKSLNSHASSGTEVDKMRAELEAKEAEIAALAQQKQDAEKKAATYKDEAGFIGQRELEKGDNELRRARQIRDALLIGRITEFVDNSEVGKFAAIEMVMPELVKVGDVLAIRRNTGILGRLKITDITSEGAIGSPMPGFGPVVPVPGDELIIEPQI